MGLSEWNVQRDHAYSGERAVKFSTSIVNQSQVQTIFLSQLSLLQRTEVSCYLTQ